MPNPTPIPVVGLSGITALAAGGSHTCALKNDGTVHCFGSNSNGQLGNSNNIDPSPSANPTPAVVPGLNNVTAVAAGSNYTCALKNDGTVHCFGGNYFGQLGNGAHFFFSSPTPAPTRVLGLSNITAITAGGLHTCALRSDGTVHCFGNNTFGQLGNALYNGQVIGQSTPVAVAGLTNVTAIASGSRHTCALKLDGTVDCFGSNESGALGNTTSIETPDPTPFPATVYGLTNITAITTGGYHTCALRNDGTMHCFGDNYSGQLGNSTNIGYDIERPKANPTPTPVDGLTNIAAMAGGGFHTCGLKIDGTVHCFGNNRSGELGRSTNNGANIANPLPVPVSW